MPIYADLDWAHLEERFILHEFVLAVFFSGHTKSQQVVAWTSLNFIIISLEISHFISIFVFTESVSF